MTPRFTQCATPYYNVQPSTVCIRPISTTSTSDGLNSSGARPRLLQDLEPDIAMMDYPYVIRVEGT